MKPKLYIISVLAIAICFLNIGCNQIETKNIGKQANEHVINNDSDNKLSTKEQNRPTPKKTYTIPIDTTNYLKKCIYHNVKNAKQSFDTVEKLLLENNIIKNRTGQGYKELFINYVKTQEFGLYNSKDFYARDSLFFIKKIQLAEILTKNIIPVENFETLFTECILEQTKKDGYEKSGVNLIEKRNKEITEALLNGSYDDQFNKYSLYELLDNEYPTEFFNIKDIQLSTILSLSLLLKDYSKEQNEMEYLKSIEILNDVENENNSQKSRSSKNSNNKNLNSLEIIEVSKEEAARLKSEGTVIEETITEKKSDTIKS